MADGLFTLLISCVLMALASFAAGMLPLAVSLSQSQLRLISTIGMGVLVGTSLIVIIPEGIDTLYSAASAAHAPAVPHAAAVLAARDHGGALADVLLPRTLLGGTTQLWARKDDDDDKEGKDITSPPPSPPPPTEDEDDGHTPAHEHDDETAAAPHRWVGLSLISGFILMYLIDVLPSHASGPSQEPYHISLDSLRSLSPPSLPTSSGSSGAHSKPASTTLGLVIHAAADGIALGASSSASNAALSAIIFLAIMLHKAPAAFGLTAVLLRSGLAKRQARTHLIVFSLAAPVGAVITWMLIWLLGGKAQGMAWWTGVLLLFSGGTFLYVAVHTMMEQGEQLRESGAKRSLGDVGAAVLGMVLPLLTQVGHHHH